MKSWEQKLTFVEDAGVCKRDAWAGGSGVSVQTLLDIRVGTGKDPWVLHLNNKLDTQRSRTVQAVLKWAPCAEQACAGY